MEKGSDWLFPFPLKIDRYYKARQTECEIARLEGEDI